MSVSHAFTAVFTAPGDEPAFDVAASVSASSGTTQRASLGRGLTFVLLLAASSLAAVYGPSALDALSGPAWVEGRVPATSPTAP